MARSAETKIQFQRRKMLRDKAIRQGQDRPYFGFIKEYNPDADTTLVDSHGGRRIIRNPQPHLGQSAWIRAAPDQGMGSLLITRSDAEEPEIMRWWHTDTQERLSLFRQNVNELISGSGQLIELEAFRPLESGEIDLSSIGGAQLFLGRRPHLDMRAGIIKLTMDQDETEFASKSPIHIRRGYQHNSSEIGDEERFGVVKRPKAGSFIDSFYPDNFGRRDEERRGFAKEYLMRLKNPQPGPPEMLFDIRAGHAMDDEGKPFRLDETGLNLRSRAEYFTPADTSILAQMDDNTNWKIEHPDDAVFGGLYILPKGSLVSRIGVDFKREIGRNEQVSIGVDRSVSVGNNDAWIVGSNRATIIGGNEQKVVGANSDEVIVGNKTIKVNGTLVIQTGAGGSILGFTEKTSAFETEVLSILATKQIIFESPKITFNTPVADFTGLIRVGAGLHSNATIVSPNGARGRAGAILATPAIRTPAI